MAIIWKEITSSDPAIAKANATPTPTVSPTPTAPTIPAAPTITSPTNQSFGSRRIWQDITPSLTTTPPTGGNVNVAQPINEPTPEGIDPALYQRLRLRGDTRESIISSHAQVKPAGFFEKVKEIKEKPTQLLPFVGSAVDIYEMGKLKFAADRLAKDEATEQDLIMLKDYADKANRDTTIGYKILDTLSYLPAFIGEIGLTGGAATAVSAGARTSIKAILKKIVSKGGKEWIAKKMAEKGIAATGLKLAERTAVGLAGRTAQAPLAGLTRIPASALQKQVNEKLTETETGEKAESLSKSLAKAFGEQWVETVSEFSGGVLGELFKGATNQIKNKVIKTALFAAFDKVNPQLPASTLERLVKRVGWNGVINEMLEERVADVGHGLLNQIGLSDQPFKLPSGEQLLTEMVAFSVPGMGVALLDKYGQNVQRLSALSPGLTIQDITKLPGEQEEKTFKTTDIQGNPIEQIFIREPKKSELTNPSKTSNFATIPDKEGWEKVYKPYGEQGKGYYYVRKEQPKEFTSEVPVYKNLQPFKGYSDLTTKFLDYAKGKTSLSKQEILDFAKRPELKRGEADLLNNLSKELPEGKLSAQDFADSIHRELLELKPVKVKEPQYAGITVDRTGGIQEDIVQSYRNAGKLGKNYEEVVFESPIATNGSSHYPNSKNYFAHARGDEVVESGKKIWREQEIQSDLLQKDNLARLKNELPGFQKEYEKALKLGINADEAMKIAEQRIEIPRLKEVGQLDPFINDRFGERIMRERIKEKAQAGYEKYRLPTGETIGKIEGFETPMWSYGRAIDRFSIKSEGMVTADNLKIGKQIVNHNGNSEWIITDILGDGRFKAVPKETYERLTKGSWIFRGKRSKDMSPEELQKAIKEEISLDAETFDLTGKSNPQYRRYENWGKFLKNKYGAELVTDKQGNTWYEIDLKPEYGKMPVEAFFTSEQKEFVYGLSLEEMRKRLKPIIGDVDEAAIFAVSRGNLGSYFDGMIKLLQVKGKVSEVVGYHESFHYVVDLLMTKAEKAEMIKWTKENKRADMERLVKANPEKAKKLDEDGLAEEVLANEFAKYVMAKAGKKAVELKSWPEKIINLFEKLIKKLAGIEENRTLVDAYFEKIRTGEFAKRAKRETTARGEAKFYTAEGADKSKIKKLQAEADKLEEKKLDLMDAYNEGFKNKRPASELKKIREEMNAVSDKVQSTLNQIEGMKGRKVVAEGSAENKIPKKIAEKETKPEVKPEKVSPQYEKLIKVVEKFKQEKVDIPVRQIAEPIKIEEDKENLEMKDIKNIEADVKAVPKAEQETERKQIDSTLNDMFEAIEELKKANVEAIKVRAEQEAIYTKERGKRADIAEEAGKKVGGLAGFYVRKSLLEGKFPKVSIKGVAKKLTQKQIDDLINLASNYSGLQFYDRITLVEGLHRLLFGGKSPTMSQEKFVIKFLGEENYEKLKKSRSLNEKIWETVIQLLNFPRTLMSSLWDMSLGGRQALPVAIAYPKIFWRMFKRQFSVFFNEQEFQKQQKEVFDSPYYNMLAGIGKYKRPGYHKVAFAEMDAALGLMEDKYASQWAQKMPGENIRIVGKLAKAYNLTIGRSVRATARTYTGGANQLRHEVAKNILIKANDWYLANKDKEWFKKGEYENPMKDIRFLSDLSGLVNNVTGRGKFGGKFGDWLEGANPLLNALFFSVRLMMSRLNLLNPYYYVKLHPFVRREALRIAMSYAAVIGAILGAASLWPDKEKIKVVWDPRNSDFMKIKLGDTRIDIMAGFQQYLRFAGQEISGKLISSTTGKEFTLGEGYQSLTRLDILARFLEMKEAPVASFFTQWLEGKSVSGEKFSVPKEISKRFVPMVITDIWELTNQNPKLLPLGILTFFGFGLQTYGAVSSSQFRDLSTTKKLTGQEFTNLKKIMQEEYKGEKKTKKELNTLFKTIQENQAALPAYEAYKKVQDKSDEEIKKALGQYSGKQIKTIEKFIKDDVRRVYNDLVGKSKEKKLEAYNKLNIFEKKVFRQIIKDNQ